jgi:adenine-specific DNA-methyltransferase
LKSLLPEFEGKVNCIYIDPPYNTGNEGWVYNDAVNDPKIKKWLGEVVGREGEDLTRHDKWLCMMYPRLKLLHRLLADDGVIFVSIDDNEEHSLRSVMNEVFGHRNFLTNFIWRKVDSPNDNKVPVTPDHEYIIGYAKNLPQLKLLQMSAPDIVNAYGSVDDQGRRYRDRLLKKNGKNSLRRDRPTMYFSLEAPDGSQVFPTHENGEEARWAMGMDGIERHRTANTLIWKQRKRNAQDVWEPYTREFAPSIPTRPYPTIWADLPTMRQAKAFLREVFNTSDLFDTPKPIELLVRLMEMFGQRNALVLDSFAGSGTTAHAVLKLNAQDGGNRRFILIEMMDYAETLTAERLRRVIAGYGEGTKAVTGLGGSFDFYTVGDPIFLPNDTLNEAVGVNVIRDYVAYTEGIPERDRTTEDNPYSPHLLGINREAAWLFNYEIDRVTVLDLHYLAGLQFNADRPENFIIYADRCLLEKSFMTKHGISFKKIPRDITRF